MLDFQPSWQPQSLSLSNILPNNLQETTYTMIRIIYRHEIIFIISQENISHLATRIDRARAHVKRKVGAAIPPCLDDPVLSNVCAAVAEGYNNCKESSYKDGLLLNTQLSPSASGSIIIKVFCVYAHIKWAFLSPLKSGLIVSASYLCPGIRLWLATPLCMSRLPITIHL